MGKSVEELSEGSAIGIDPESSTTAEPPDITGHNRSVHNVNKARLGFMKLPPITRRLLCGAAAIAAAAFDS
jgi:hypothetical protein